MTVDRKAAKSENKKKSMIESQRLHIEDVSDEEAVDNQDVMDHKLKTAVPYIEGHDVESSGDSSDSDDSNAVAKARFVNPLLTAVKTKKEKEEESAEEWSDESDDDLNDKKKKKDKKTLLGKRGR